MFAALALACGGSRTSSAPAAGPPAAARAYTATRWIPAKPTYALEARSARDAQRTIKDVVDSLGMIVDLDSSQVSAALRVLLAMDPLAPDALAAMGIDLEGGIAVFSESIHPTFVVHLSAPEQTAAYFDQERSRGLDTQSQIVDLAPAGLTTAAWEFLLRTARIPFSKRVAERLQSWSEAHLSIRVVDETRLVFEANGSRR